MAKTEPNAYQAREPYRGDEVAVLNAPGLIYLGPCKLTGIHATYGSGEIEIEMYDGVNATGRKIHWIEAPAAGVHEMSRPRGIRCDIGIYLDSTAGSFLASVTYVPLPKK